ncbi:DMT family transporter [Gracilimonas mengyeensis]|uniref:Permease of the drug/metabolite transporter (DMT) superfamily n=1 Tax=Gracilimonas mengyeensis TaxID=1302730 RepID=A0A521EGC2_9BACT|nr:DMT family transporter [Gracilimonas mengyeensis]SMO82963.1 Permease of the drug/metabolite transporter (DMT) superfamily [Gracilimonas mengyeensis]
MEQSYSKLKVYGILVLGLITFGFAPVLVKFATDYSALLLVTIRTVGAFLMLVPFYLYKKQSKQYDLKPVGNDSKWMVLAGIALGLHFTLWTSSLFYTSVASASVLVTIHPIMLIVAERILYKMKFPVTVWWGVFVAFGGSVLLGISDYNAEAIFENPLLGNSMAFAAAAIFAVYFLIGRKVRQNRSWLGYVFPVYGYAAATCVVILLVIEGVPESIDVRVLWVGLALSVGPQLMGHGSLNYAVKYVSATLLSTLILTEPVFATILAFFILDELPPVLSFIAIFVTLCGVMLTWKKKSISSDK